MKAVLLLFFIGCTLATQAQVEIKTHVLYYAFALGAGIGVSPTFENADVGIGSMLAFNLHKNKALASLAYRATGELEFLGRRIPAHTMSSLELLYGRQLVAKKWKISLNSGVSLVGNLLRGVYLNSEGGLFSPQHYERYKFYTIGLPISAKFFRPGKSNSGIGFETYVNINKMNVFYGVNIYAEIFKNKFRKKGEKK